jgi:hypothetical protein
LRCSNSDTESLDACDVCDGDDADDVSVGLTGVTTPRTDDAFADCVFAATADDAAVVVLAGVVADVIGVIVTVCGGCVDTAVAVAVFALCAGVTAFVLARCVVFVGAIALASLLSCAVKSSAATDTV